MLERQKGWNALESCDDMLVLNLEREMVAEGLGVHVDTLPPIAGASTMDTNDQLTA